MAMSPQVFQELETVTCLLSGTSYLASRLGRVSLAALFFVRFGILAVGGRSIWMEEEKNFMCNSTQLLCTPSCFDEFSPISSFNLFALQLVVLVTHALSVTCWNRSTSQAKETRLQAHLSRRNVQITLHILCLLSRILIEGVFVFTFYKVSGGFVHPAVTHCRSHLCERFVVCTDLNAFTKNVFSLGLCAASVLSIIICCSELIITSLPRQRAK
ncbi:gap junction beta-1 protein-like [Spea bombifrons]|uniref:gap junction beta-1 protein-like n=1 Tax=Spea bombifrons TaxID=233779 RepID=UPI0023498592|nr:gap junction beta-1 protein-like [Spea bombifrons]